MRCERCARDTPTRPGEACLWCGHVAGAGPWQTPNAPGGGAPPSGGWGDGPGIPWENEQNAKHLLETMKLAALSPTATFAGASRTMGIVPSMVFALIVGLAGGVVSMVWTFALGSSANTEALKNLPPEMQGVGEAFAQISQPGIGSVVMLPVTIMIGLFLGTVLVHVGLLIVGGANGRFEDSFRAVAFASGSTALLQIIPFLGSFIAALWALVIEVIAIRELHGTTTMKALIAVLLPVVLILGCVCCVGIFAAGAIGGLLGAGS